MSSRKDETKKYEEQGGRSTDRFSVSMLKYFWQMNSLTNRNKDSIPKFLRNIEPLKNFSDFELFYLSQYFHIRTFDAEEVIFNQGDVGVGFYLIYQGNIEIAAHNLASEVDAESKDKQDETIQTKIAFLERTDYFGELALLQENSLRSAGAKAKTPATLLGIFKPDLEMLIDDRPKIAAKLLQSISIIVANRLYYVTREVKMLKYRLNQNSRN